MVQIGYVLRIFFAGICGLMIGIERRNRLKEAGIRTHLIVALGSALMMIVSKYGFFDLQGHSFLRADASRIASQIVSGIGFLGAGIWKPSYKTGEKSMSPRHLWKWLTDRNLQT